MLSYGRIILHKHLRCDGQVLPSTAAGHPSVCVDSTSLSPLCITSLSFIIIQQQQQQHRQR